MLVYVVLFALKADAFDVDSVWSTRDGAGERVQWLMQASDYTRVFGRFRIIRFVLDTAKGEIVP